MVSIYDLAVYKEQYEGHKIIYVLFNNKEFIFRTLGRKEYSDITSILTDEYELEDAICQVALIEPVDLDFAKNTLAGISNYIAPIILEESGFTDLNMVLGSYYKSKDKMHTFEEQSIALVKAAMPEYKYEDIEEWTWDKLMTMTARAEYIMNLKGIQVDLIDKQAEIEEQAEQSPVDNKQVAKELREQGIDPMVYFENDIDFQQPYLDFPLIGGRHWQDGGVVDEIRNQMEKRKLRR